MLTIVPTPIGNLDDISFRAIESLKNCDLILCEDTRHSKKLLAHFDITTPTKSYHQFNEAKACTTIIDGLKNGRHYCLISDAGTPTISDPGSRLVKACVDEGIEIDSIPGPCAAIVALTLSGLNTDQFQFVGFLPKKETAIRKELFSIMHYPGTTICYESPRRLINIIKIIQQIDPDRTLAVTRELTKTFQEVIRGTPNDILRHFTEKEVKGEIVLLIGSNQQFNTSYWKDLPVEKTIEELEKTYSLSRMEAIKTLASLREESKREIYKKIQDS